MRALSKLTRTALLASALVSFSLSGLAQQPTPPKRVLVLYWYARDIPANIDFASQFQAAIGAAGPGAIEIYSEYLESNKFPGENQSLVLRDYLRRKYADRTIDVVVPTAHATLDFLLTHRDVLFPNSPIVFATMKRPTPEQLLSGRGATGILYIQGHKKTLDLALKLHPSAEQVFVISGTSSRDEAFETLARQQLQGYEGKVDLPPFLTHEVKTQNPSNGE